MWFKLNFWCSGLTRWEGEEVFALRRRRCSFFQRHSRGMVVVGDGGAQSVVRSGHRRLGFSSFVFDHIKCPPGCGKHPNGDIWVRRSERCVDALPWYFMFCGAPPDSHLFVFWVGYSLSEKRIRAPLHLVIPMSHAVRHGWKAIPIPSPRG